MEVGQKEPSGRETPEAKGVSEEIRDEKKRVKEDLGKRKISQREEKGGSEERTHKSTFLQGCQAKIIGRVRVGQSMKERGLRGCLGRQGKIGPLDQAHLLRSGCSRVGGEG